MTESAAEAKSIEAEPPGLGTLFLAFASVAVSGFGGVMPFARRMLVEQRRWITPDEFNEAYAVAQFLPGGNILNLGVVIGRRFHGIAGALAATIGLLAGPFAIVTTLGAIYTSYGDIPAIQNGLAGVAAAAAGLLLAMAAKMAEPLIRRRALASLAVAGLAFVGGGVAGLPLLPVLVTLAPISFALAWRRLL